jgi:hypothetical protein
MEEVGVMKKILVVDNEPALVRAYMRMTKGLAIVLSADDTDRGYKLIVENPDLHAVIMDSDTRGRLLQTTYALALSIKAHWPKCILVAATGSPGSCTELVDICDQILVKPFGKKDFLKALGLITG